MKLVDTFAKLVVTFQDVIVFILMKKNIQKFPIHCPITTKLGKSSPWTSSSLLFGITSS
jgi:hypothetical protein